MLNKITEKLMLKWLKPISIIIHSDGRSEMLFKNRSKMNFRQQLMYEFWTKNRSKFEPVNPGRYHFDAAWKDGALDMGLTSF